MSSTHTDHTQAAAGTISPAAAVVRCEDLHVAWDTQLILHGVSTQIPAGQAIAVTGANGSGKSTLMRTLMGTAPITGGAAYLFGADVSQPRSVPWHRVGYVPQRFNSGGGIASSVEEVVCSGLLGPRRWWARPGDRTRALEALERVGLTHRAKDPMPILSGGQQQRALIARALVRNPDLLVMDEPLAGIDAHSRERLAEVVSEAKAQGTTILLVLHELGELGPLLDRELHLASGHISYDGPAHLESTEGAHALAHHHRGEKEPGHSYSAATLSDIIGRSDLRGGDDMRGGGHE